jgi:hypothetical protein
VSETAVAVSRRGVPQDLLRVPAGDVPGTAEFDAAVLAISAVTGLFLIAVGSIRLASGIRRRR